MATYTYSISTDTLNGNLWGPKLTDEIFDVGLDTDFEYFYASGDNLYIIYTNALSGGDETILDGVISNHDGIDPNIDNSISEFDKADSSGHKKFTYIVSVLTKIEIFSDENLTMLIYTKDLNYTGDKMTSIVLTREIDLQTYTKTIIYSGDDVLRVEYS